MADVFPYHQRTMASYSPTQQQIYPPSLPQPTNSASPEDHDDGDATPPKSDPKLETKPQATFLTKLYAYVRCLFSVFFAHFLQAARASRVPLDD
jgi:hypothetical protein